MDAMPTRLSARVSAISESATLAVDAKAKALKAAGRPVIGFGAGEPDFPTPDYIVEAAQRACEQPRFHKYTPAAGLPELREAIAAKTARDSGYQVEPSQVLVTNGGKQAVYETFATLLDPGDEVIVPAPYWTTYPEVIALAGGVMRPVLTDERSGYLASVRGPGGGPHGPEQDRAVRVAVQPDRGRLPAGSGRRHRRMGGGPRPVGGHRRDLRAPGLRRRGVLLDPGPGPADRRHLRGAERRGQDLRDDRLAGGLDDRAQGRDQRRGEHAEPRHLQRVQRGPGGGAGRRVRATCRRSRPCARRSTGAG